MNSVPPSPGPGENQGLQRSLRCPKPPGGDCSGGSGRRRTLGLLGVLAAGLLGGGLWLGRLPALQAAPQPTVLVLGMQLPRNYNPRYRDEFTAVFPRVAQDHQATLVPFFLESVTAPGEMQRFFQSDGIHPNELAQPPMMDSVWRVIEPLLQRRGSTP